MVCPSPPPLYGTLGGTLKFCHTVLSTGMVFRWGVGCRRACHRVATIAQQPCIRCGMARGGRPRDIRTMMQPCASAARLLGGGPILSLGSKPWVGAGHRHLGSSWRCIAPAADERQTCLTPPLLVSAPCGVSADPLRLPAAA